MGEFAALLGAIAGFIAACAFLIGVFKVGVPLVKLGKTLDGITDSIKELTEHTVPVIDESATTLASTNAQLVKVDTITTSAAQVSENVSALTALYAATLGKPLVKVAAFSYGVRQGLRTAWRANSPKEK